MRRFIGMVMCVAVLLGLAPSGESAQGTRSPFLRGWTGHFAVNAGWTWNPNGDTPGGQALCDGAERTLAQIVIPAGTPPNLRIVNNQFMLGLDGSSSAWLTAKLVYGSSVVDQATIWHPVNGFSPAQSAIQNPFHVLSTPVPVGGPGLFRLVVSCVTVTAGALYCPGQTSPTPCMSAIAAYGLTYDGLASPTNWVSATSPTAPLSCDSPMWPGPERTLYWSAPAGRVRSTTIFHSTYPAGGLRQPLIYTLGPDGTLVSMWTAEDYAGVGGSAAFKVTFDPDWLVVPSGGYQTRALIDCQGTHEASLTFNQSFKGN